MTALTQRVDERARGVSFSRVALTAVAAVLFAVGWVVGKSFSVVWVVLVWCALAVRVGWDDARAATPVDRGGG